MTRPVGCDGSILSLAACGVVTRSLRERVDAAAEREVHVFLAPHHALGHAGGAAGVEQVDVVVGALAEVALGRARRDRGLELDRVERRSRRRRSRPTRCGRSAASFGCASRAAATSGAVLALVDERDEVGVLEEVAQLLLDVAEVDVHDARPDLVDREHRLDPLDAVRREDADVIAGLARPRAASVCASRVARSSSSR